MTLAPIPPPYEPDPEQLERIAEDEERIRLAYERKLDLEVRHAPAPDFWWIQIRDREGWRGFPPPPPGHRLVWPAGGEPWLEPINEEKAA
jgi:hypothetical protein